MSKKSLANEFPINFLPSLCSFGQDFSKSSSTLAILWSPHARGGFLVVVKVIGNLSLRRMKLKGSKGIRENRSSTYLLT